MDYVKPQIVDYGTLEELTAALVGSGGEDGANKAFHGCTPRP